MTRHNPTIFFGCRKPAIVPNLEIPGSCINIDRTFTNIESHYAVDFRAMGTDITEFERYLYGHLMSEHDIGIQMGPEEYMPNVIKWKNMSETNQAVDIVPVAEEISYDVSSRERPLGNLDAGMRVLRVRDSDVKIPLNKVGIYESKIENKRQDVNNYLNTEEAELLNRFMNKKDYTLQRDITSFRVGDEKMPDIAIAGVHPIHEYIVFNKKFSDLIAEQAALHGVDFDTKKYYTILHELIHLYGINSEEKLEELALEFYLTLASKEYCGYSIENPRSSNYFENKSKKQARIPAQRLQEKAPRSIDIETLVTQLFNEADKKGLTKEEASDYVNAYLEIYEKAGSKEKEYSEKTEELAKEEAIDKEEELAAEEAVEACEAEGE